MDGFLERDINKGFSGGEIKRSEVLQLMIQNPDFLMLDEPESGVESMVRTFQRFSKTNYYFVFWVYEDSFAAFNRAKETAASLGFQYGWDPVARNTKLKLGERGTSIPPQN